MKTSVKKEELWTYLQEHLDWLRKSNQHFDNGDLSEAKRISHTLRSLLHQTKNSHSLLHQLKLLPGMAFISTADNRTNIIPLSESRLICMKMGPHKAEFVANCNMPEMPWLKDRVIFFPDWWNENVIFLDNKTLNRRELILFVANKLGGSHVDPSIDEDIAKLIRGGSLTTEFFDVDGNKIPLKEAELHSIRQISHEVIASIERKLKNS